MKEIDGGITAPGGFKAGAVTAGIKKNQKPDLALIYSETDAVVAGTFTQHSICSPTVTLSRQRLGVGRGIIVNSGNANAATGAQGMRDAKEMAAAAAKALDVDDESIFVASTGVIGEKLPIEKITAKTALLADAINATPAGSLAAAKAIMTTDTRPKEIAVEVEINGCPVIIGGIAKGSGMIAPNMATMLAFITTDANIEQELLQKLLTAKVNWSFNMITIDRDTSTNDMVLAMANGSSGSTPIGNTEDSLEKFADALEMVCNYLAKEMVRDAEGASKLITVNVNNATSYSNARTIAFSIAESTLVKVAFFAEDANWGRIIAAAGKSNLHINEGLIDLYFDGVKMVANGVGLGEEAEKKVAEVLKNSEFSVTLDLKRGMHSATVWTSDLTYEYIKINSEYRT